MTSSKNFMPNIVAFTTLIDGYCERGELGLAEKCMEEMVEWKCEPNVVTYNSLINGYCLSGNIESTMRTMMDMRFKGLKDNIATHTSQLKGFGIAGRSKDAIKHLKEMGYAIIASLYYGLDTTVTTKGVITKFSQLLKYWFYEYCGVGQRIFKEALKFTFYSHLKAWEKGNRKKTNDQTANLFTLGKYFINHWII
ncbi:hypothetical protein GIB67_002375 [Kingdonia uniflora]|uniref:Pentatricopeptide repeat-containing protein n=1 Tax=Kingdonia uniflora TaxID=39325 RepID=A0A7J7M8C4_9MAGN|nr:hypothetical protein GIB67_002375 [Kingdonia uniflora]